VPGVGVSKTVDVSVKKNLVRQKVLTGAAVVEKVRRGLPARLDEGERGDELEREGRKVSPRVSQQQGQRWLHTGKSPAWVSVQARGADNLMISCCTLSSVRA
jgi:hypothetical protein